MVMSTNDSPFRDDPGFLNFKGSQGSETHINHAQNTKLMAKLNSTPRDDQLVPVYIYQNF